MFKKNSVLPLTSVRIAKIKVLRTIYIVRMWSQGITPPQLVVLQNCTITLEISMAISWTIGNQSTSKPMILLLDIYPKYTQS